MRIIAGTAKGSQIFAPKGQDTRPTQDRVRESLFNILQGDVPDAVVLDLFAGSGALALEALSRGSAEAVLVDGGQEAMGCIQRNLSKLNFESRALTMKCDWQTALQQLSGRGKKFDLIFLDPPYLMTDTLEICLQLVSKELLMQDALIVVEHRKGKEPGEHPLFQKRKMRSYGDTEISFLDYIPR